MKTILQISSGQGPAECRKLVSVLSKVIYEDAIKNNIKCVCLNEIKNEMASIKYIIEGEGIDGFRKNWNGTVKWIWQSTIRPDWKRKNWFVKVSFFEFESKDIKFDLNDIKIETCRASGHGGQHVNTTDTAVRVIHLPSGIEATASEERSQHLNKELALLRLQEKLHLVEEKNKADEKTSLWIDHYKLERGNPVRTFKGIPLKEVK